MAARPLLRIGCAVYFPCLGGGDGAAVARVALAAAAQVQAIGILGAGLGHTAPGVERLGCAGLGQNGWRAMRGCAIPVTYNLCVRWATIHPGRSGPPGARRCRSL